MSIQLICGKCDPPSPTSELERERVGNEIWKHLECGHIEVESLRIINNIEDYHYDDGRVPRPHQIRDLQFGMRANHRWLCADDTGLGKTLVACATLKLWQEELTPCLVVCKSALKAQWIVEIIKACGATVIPYPIDKSNEIVPKGFGAYVISYDLLKLLLKQRPGSFDHCKYVIADEVQLIKNKDSQRASAFQTVCAGKPYILALSATPYKNHLAEYFTILNILDPGKFHDFGWFCETFVETYYNEMGLPKFGGLMKSTQAWFKELISDLVIRHERAEVAPELPPFIENQRFCEIESKSDKKEWEQALKEFDEIFDEAESEGMNSAGRLKIGASLMHLKKLAGLYKVNPTLEFVRSFLEENPSNGQPGRKLTLFVHHIEVGNRLERGINDFAAEFGINPVLRIEGGGSTQSREKIASNCAQFYWPSNVPEDRVLICSTLSGGEGLNLQACYDSVLVERQWNPANENQARGRFSRYGTKASNIWFYTMTLLDSIDETLVALNERKGSYQPGITGELGANWSESEFMMELADKLRNRKKK